MTTRRTCAGPLARAAWLACLLAAACAGEEPAVNRVQANALSKAIFDGDWYLHRTVIDTPYGASATFVGEGYTLHRIRWSIEEDFLIARRTYQFAAGTENGGVAGAGVERGAPIAMYEIESHFDIRRAYNPSTGEELNVVEENDTDRPWYEREYVRVDWSENLISDEDTGVTSSLAAVELEPVNYFVQSPDHPWAPRFEADASGDVTYIDIVNKYFAKPDTVSTQTSDGAVVEVPRCYLVSDMHIDCQPAEIAVRSSYLKVDPDHDYEPLEYTESRMTRFGYFLSVRDGYDPSYGVTSNQRFRFANRHNIWERSHLRTEDGEWMECVQHDECPGDGSYCDVTFARAKRLSKGRCTIPFREREVRPIAYHVSEQFPEDLFPTAAAMVGEWNDALRRTIGSLRAIECEEEEGDDCDSHRDVDEDAFVLCHNPVEAGDPDGCGEEGTIARIGDIRFHMLAWVNEPHVSSPLGYGPSYPDPETGEIISATAFLYGAAFDTVTATGRDLVALLNGDLEESQIQDNRAFGEWIRLVRNGRFTQSGRDDVNRHVVDVGPEDVAAIDAAMSFDWMRELASIRRGEGAVPKPSDLLARWTDAKARIVDAVGELRMGDLGRARLQALRGTKFESMLIDDETVLAAGFPPGTPLADEVDEVIERASPLRGMSREAMQAREALRQQVHNPANGCIVTAGFMDEGILGLAREVSRAAENDEPLVWYGQEYTIRDEEGGIDYAAVERMLRQPVFRGVAAHEVGHTLGLRHNFVGSYDAMNYHDRYWDLRLDGEVASRLYDPMTDAEIDGRIREYQYSTVMDYPQSSVVGDAAGLGKYDAAAIKMGYGDLVEVFDEVPEANRQVVAQIGALQDFGWPAALDIAALDRGEVRVIPYTEYPGLVGGKAGLRARSEVRFTSLIDDSGSLGAGLPTSAPDLRPTVPYRYCGDEFVDFSPECLRYDAGADVYETVMSIADSYWNYYVFNNFMRQRLGFDPDAVPGRTYSRYFSKLEGANTYYTLFRGILEDLGATDEFFVAEDGFGPFTAAIGGAYELFGKVLGTPEPGSYAVADGRYEVVDPSNLLAMPDLEIDTFDGRRLRTGYDYGPEQSFFFLTRAGFFQDKALALESLTWSGVRVIGQDTTSDVRRFQISYFTTFPDATSSLFRAAIGDDWETFAPRAVDDGGALALAYPDVTQHLDRNAIDGTVVDPNLGFTLQFYAMVYGMTLIPRSFDQSFVDRARIYVEGGAESVSLDPSITTIRFVDDSGLVYIAPSYLDGSGKELGIGAQVLLRAQALKDAGADAELDAWMDNVNILRELTWQVGFGAPYAYEP